MGEGANQVGRDEPRTLREGERITIRPGDPAAHLSAGGIPEDEANGRAVPAGLTQQDEHEGGAGTVETAAIESEIAQTRGELGDTIDEIQRRLSPEHVKEEAKESALELADYAKQAAREAIQEARDAVRGATIGRIEEMAHTMGDTARETRHGIMETIRQNPVPTALTGVGVAWLLLNRQSSPPRRPYYDGVYGESRVYRDPRDGGERYSSHYSTPYSYQEGVRDGARPTERRQDDSPGLASRVQEQAGRAGETLGQAAGQVGDTLSQAAGRVGEMSGAMMDRTHRNVESVEGRVGRALQDSPLIVGAVALALGAAIGLVVPETSKEHELFGAARDDVLDQAQGFARETMEKVRGIASEAGETIQQEARAQGLTS